MFILSNISTGRLQSKVINQIQKVYPCNSKAKSASVLDYDFVYTKEQNRRLNIHHTMMFLFKKSFGTSVFTSPYLGIFKVDKICN